jgi:hypothetical protein
MATFREAMQAKTHLLKKWKKMPGVIGIGVGFTNGKNAKGGMCVVLYTVDASTAVLKRCPRCVAVKGKAVAKSVSVPVRTVTSGRCCCHPGFQPLAESPNLRDKIRPVVAGYSVGTPEGTGTAGLIVNGAIRQAQRYLLSNNHVLNRNNTSGYSETIQPGGADGGRSVRDRIGRLHRFVQLRRDGVNFMDAAISIPTINSVLAPRYARVGSLRGHVRSYSVGSRFKKVGRTTGLVSGVVQSINTDILVDYGNYGGLGTIRFQNQTIISSNMPVSMPGDSGSVWLTANNYAAAVNFAGSEDGRISISFPVHWAIQAFGLRVPGLGGSSTGKAGSSKGRKNAATRPLTASELSRISIRGAKKMR